VKSPCVEAITVNRSVIGSTSNEVCALRAPRVAKRGLCRRGPPRGALQSTQPKVCLGETRTPHHGSRQRWARRSERPDADLRCESGGLLIESLPHPSPVRLDLDAPVRQPVDPTADTLVEGMNEEIAVVVPALNFPEEESRSVNGGAGLARDSSSVPSDSLLRFTATTQIYTRVAVEDLVAVLRRHHPRTRLGI